MGTVTLHPGRLTVHREPGHTCTVWPEGACDLLPYMLYSLDLDPEFTLGDLLRFFDRDDVSVIEVILAEQLGPLLEEARGGTSDSDGAATLHFLRVSTHHEHIS